MRYQALLLVGTIFSGLVSVAANAQSPAAIEEVVVTATKRAQSIQDIPIAVSAFSGQELDARGIRDVSQLQQVSPSLLINTANSSSKGGTLRIRGIGTIGNNIGLESAVGFFQDGAYRGRSGHALNELLDIERVEVLRGPQGTVFGKNTSAGAVSVISRAPEFDFGGSISASFGSLDYRKVEGMLTGPIVADKLAFRIAGAWTKRDGYIREFTTHEDFNDRDRWAVKGQLLWTPNERFTARLIFDSLEKQESCCAASFRIVGPTGPILQALGGTTEVSGDGSRVGVNRAPLDHVKDSGAVLELEWSGDMVTLTSVSTYREFEAHRGQDVDFTDVDLFQFSDTLENFDSWSQELRLTGSTERLDWLLGGYVSGEEISSRGRPLVGLATQGPAYIGILFGNPLIATLLQQGDGVSASFGQDADSWAVFTNNTWRFGESWNFNLGLRYSNEDKAGSSLVNETGTDGVVDNNWPCTLVPVPTFCGNAGYALERSEDRLTGTAKIQYDFSDDVNAYAGWSTGYKAGGFNLDPLAYKLDTFGNVIGDGREFEKETVESFELGLKSVLLDGRMTLNVAAFYSEFKDFQVNTFTGTVFVVENVPEVVSKGIEVDHSWSIADGVVLNGGVAYTDARYTADTPILNATAALGGPTNLKDMNVTNAPKWQSSLGLQIDRAMPSREGWRYSFNTNWMYRSSYNTGADLDPQKEQSAFSLVNAQIGLRKEDDSLELLLWANNVFDQDYRQYVFDSVLQPGSWSQTVGEPQVWGITLRTRF